MTTGQKPPYTAIPSPADFRKKQREAFNQDVEALVERCLKKLEGQLSGVPFRGVVEELSYPLSLVEKEAIERFKKSGWAVTIDVDHSRVTHHNTRLVFTAAPEG
jgi:hypothetical protein